MYNKIKLILLVVSVLISLRGEAQNVLSLQECLKIGIENNLDLKAKRQTIDKSGLSISENRARMLPQVYGFANFNDNFKPPVSVTDGSSYGVPYNVTHTLQYGMNYGINLSWQLFNEQIFRSQELVKLVAEIDKMSYEKAREELILQISKMYFVAQSTKEQIRIANENIARLEALQDITKAFFDNGMVMEVDCKRVGISLESVKIQCENAQSILDQQMNLLKFIIDYSADSTFVLEPLNPENVETPAESSLRANDWTLQLLDQQKLILEKQKEMVVDGYKPSLSLSSQYLGQAFTDKFSNWFHSGASNKLYHSFGIGLSLYVPIFDGLDKKYKRQKFDVDIDINKSTYEYAQKSLETQYLNSTIEVENSLRNFQRQRDNYKLAEDVYTVTSDQYKEGVASMTAVLQDEMSMSSAQNDYISAHTSFRLAYLTFLQLTGNLETLLN